jgi:hypothetical protein
MYEKSKGFCSVISNTYIEHCHHFLIVEIQQFGNWLYAHHHVKIDTYQLGLL